MFSRTHKPCDLKASIHRALFIAWNRLLSDQIWDLRNFAGILFSACSLLFIFGDGRKASDKVCACNLCK